MIHLRIPPGEREGFINMYFPSQGFQMYVIDIHSVSLPEETGYGRVPSGKIVKINYCEHGRCELRTRLGEVTYLVGGEVAVDTGQTESHFYYPTSDYAGIEIVAVMDDLLETIPSLQDSLPGYAGVLKKASLRKVEAEPRPLIFQADETIARISSDIKAYDAMGLGGQMLMLKGLEFLIWLEHLLPHVKNIPRRFYTSSQTEIARCCFELISGDLHERWTAKALAERFGISESSVKNYFRNVYGYGFSEYQNRLRMEAAAEGLAGSDATVGEIARSVGVSSQTRVAEAVEKSTGSLPLEYRRRQHLKK